MKLRKLATATAEAAWNRERTILRASALCLLSLSLATNAYAVISTGLCALPESGRWTDAALPEGSAFGGAVALDGNTGVLGAYNAPAPDSTSLGTGAVYIYDLSSESPSLVQVLHPSDSIAHQFGWSVAISGSTIVVGEPAAYLNDVPVGLAYVYERIDGAWQQTAQLSMAAAQSSDAFGYSVAIHNETIVVGARNHQETPGIHGAAAVFQNSGGGWQQVAEFDNPASGSSFGTSFGFGASVTVFNDTIAVGAEGDRTDGVSVGSVYLYDRDDAGWQLSQRLAAPASGTISSFGRRVSMRANTLAVAMPNAQSADSNPGGAVIYERSDSGQWVEGLSIAIPQNPQQPSSVLRIGTDVATDGDHVVVSARTFRDDVARFYYFRKVAGNWQLTQRFSPEVFDYNGSPVLAMRGDTVLAGISQNTEAYPQGYAIRFAQLDDYGDCNGNGVPDDCDIGDGIEEDCNGNGVPDSCDVANGSSADCNGNGFPDECETAERWENDRLTPSHQYEQQNFGASIAVDGDTAIIGARGSTITTDNAPGEAYVFQNVSGWNETDQLMPDDDPAPLTYGASVALSGDTAVVGAPYDDAGVAFGAGSAYVFRETDGTWTQISKLTAPNAAEASYFGGSVAIEGDTIVVGASGVSDSSMDNVGAAYIFKEINGTWQLAAQLSPPEAGISYEFGASVAIRGNLIAVGAPINSSAFLYRKLEGTWQLTQHLPDEAASVFPYFGTSVAIGDYAIVVGAINYPLGPSSATGRAYVFEPSYAGWEQVATLQNAVSADNDNFGARVAIGDGVIAVCDFLRRPFGGISGTGVITLYRRTWGEWVQDVPIAVSNAYESAGDALGASVAVVGNQILCGAVCDVDSIDAGAVYVYDITDTSVKGDLDDDGDIDAIDEYVFVNVLLGIDLDPADFARADSNCDGTVDGRDLQSFVSRWLMP